MSILAEILFFLFQTLPMADKSERAKSSKFAAVALVVVVLAVVVLICRYNPAPQHQVPEVMPSISL